jgi:endonuclease-3
MARAKAGRTKARAAKGSARGRRASRPRRRLLHAQASRILEALEKAHPEATCALRYGSPFQLLVATILSAQCTDQRVNMVTPALFGHFPDARSMAAADPAELQEIIRSTGFFRAKARSLIGAAKALVGEHAGQVPPSMEALVRLPGTGRKTANVVLGHAFGRNDGIAVDTHVLRVSNRIGLAATEDPAEAERRLMDLFPRDSWTRVSDLLIFHGRKVCAARKPACAGCTLFPECRWERRQAFAHAATSASSRLSPSRPARPAKERRARRP